MQASSHQLELFEEDQGMSVRASSTNRQSIHFYSFVCKPGHHTYDNTGSHDSQGSYDSQDSQGSYDSYDSH